MTDYEQSLRVTKPPDCLEARTTALPHPGQLGLICVFGSLTSSVHCHTRTTEPAIVDVQKSMVLQEFKVSVRRREKDAKGTRSFSTIPPFLFLQVCHGTVRNGRTDQSSIAPCSGPCSKVMADLPCKITCADGHDLYASPSGAEGTSKDEENRQSRLSRDKAFLPRDQVDTW